MFGAMSFDICYLLLNKFAALDIDIDFSKVDSFYIKK